MNAPDNKTLAASARAVADRAPRGSLDRRSWACAAVALSTTRSIAAARKALAEVTAADVRGAALDAIDSLAELAGEVA